MVHGGSVEENISAKQRKAKTMSRLPSKDAHRRWKKGHNPSPGQGAKAAGGDHSQQGTLTRKGERYPPSIRIRSTGDYRRIQSSGRRFRTASLIVLFTSGRSNSSRVGLTVGRRVGNAVVRNRVKRWLREAVRLNYGRLPGRLDVVFVAVPAASRAGAKVLAAEVEQAFNKLSKAPSG